jgi:hypothetical protein
MKDENRYDYSDDLVLIVDLNIKNTTLKIFPKRYW